MAASETAVVAGPVERDRLRILVVESHAGDAELLVRGLRRHSYQVDRASTGSQALQIFDDADLVLLDLELPDLDGLEVCRDIRSASGIPVIAVTARATELDKVLGLQAGADDYLVKPYGFRELMARIDAVMRRVKPAPPIAEVLVHGRLKVDAGAREVTVDGEVVELTRKEFDLLYLLASRSGDVVPRRQIMAQVWGDSWSRRTIDTHVSSLRGKLGSSEWVISVRGVGFRLGQA
ncbi:response regulator transcription factor [Streptomyces sp. H27-C3]|uniref:response regulator transcription factor n=1 Tax=Streptomyces sp. H27-C3 TaxID=3046305 RepID=UPI0024BAFC12|nr:response regulator transcription factor [Streptomyces sp. H27-C3]MDJ0466248.1 response regulator transcription factor [Streptomyces sp. H27-C3]